MRIMHLGFLLAFTPVWVTALPPPPVQYTAECSFPVYASDTLVCEDSELLELDRLLAMKIEQGELAAAPSPDPDDSQDWFRRSRLCAFEADHRACLRTAYCLRLALLDQVAELPAACSAPPGDYIAVVDIAESGFVRKDLEPQEIPGQMMALSGYVDHHNIYGDEDARNLLGEWWAGYGPDSTMWRFNLKAHADDDAGQSFAVFIPIDLLSGDILKIFLQDAKKGRPTKVYLEGKLTIFEAPANTANFHGLSMQLQSTRDIRLGSRLPE